MKPISLLPAALVVMTQVAVAATALPPELETQACDIALELRCPVCRGVPIKDSPSELAQSMMGVIREKIAAGESREHILQYFVDRYGEWILLKPKAEGLHLALWLLPIALLLGGGIFLAVTIRRWTRGVGK